MRSFQRSINLVFKEPHKYFHTILQIICYHKETLKVDAVKGPAKMEMIQKPGIHRLWANTEGLLR